MKPRIIFMNYYKYDYLCNREETGAKWDTISETKKIFKLKKTELKVKWTTIGEKKTDYISCT